MAPPRNRAIAPAASTLPSSAPAVADSTPAVADPVVTDAGAPPPLDAKPVDAKPAGTSPGGTSSLGNFASNIKSWGSFLVTVFIFIAFFWVLYFVLHNIGSSPTKDTQGNVVDKFARSKDILTVVLSLTTAAVGYWFGSDGKSKVEDQAAQAQTHAADAQNQANQAKSQVVKAEKQKSAILDASPPGALLKAKNSHPELF